jgi:hypothetical protein
VRGLPEGSWRCCGVTAEKLVPVVHPIRRIGSTLKALLEELEGEHPRSLRRQEFGNQGSDPGGDVVDDRPYRLDR